MFETCRPKTLDEALKLMAQKTWIPLAGGTDLMIRARNWQGARRNFKGDVLLIAHLEELRGIWETESSYMIGAATTQTEVVSSDMLPDYVRHVVSEMATPAIRNAATVGGNIINAASVADILPLAYVCDAKVHLKSARGTRTVPIASFMIGKYQTDRKPDELMTALSLPKLAVKAYTYRKMGQRRASILSKVSFLAVQTDCDVRIAIGALNDMVLRSVEVEKSISQGASVASVLAAYGALYESHDDKRSTKAYKERVANNLIREWMEGHHGL